MSEVICTVYIHINIAYMISIYNFGPVPSGCAAAIHRHVRRSCTRMRCRENLQQLGDNPCKFDFRSTYLLEICVSFLFFHELLGDLCKFG